MSRISSQAEADRLNETGTTDPYHAANGHVMIASLRFPRRDDGSERDYEIGDEIRYNSWSAWCAPSCSHRELGPLEDW